jgi:hypothetical protein
VDGGLDSTPLKEGNGDYSKFSKLPYMYSCTAFLANVDEVKFERVVK